MTQFLLALFLCCSIVNVFIALPTLALEFTPGMTMNGFEVKEVKPLAEYGGKAIIFEHQKTAAQVIFIQNADPHLAFSISFRTFPHNNQGHAHVLEHSVLAGSQNYPARNTFEALSRGSFSTFVNAMTGSDVTTYPVATTNRSELENMVKVYLDAVFFPRIYQEPMIMAQEGIRLSYHPDTTSLQYEGVVFNEMLAEQNNPTNLILVQSLAELFPNTSYRFTAGGISEEMPGLTNQDLLAFHQEFYHPSNSQVMLYGNITQVDDLLGELDRNFSHFEHRSFPPRFQNLRPLTQSIHQVVTYDPGEAPSGKLNYHLFTYRLPPSATDPVESMGLDLLSALLSDGNNTPLTKRMREANIAPQIQAFQNKDLPTSIFGFLIKHTDQNQGPALVQLIETELQRLAQEGFEEVQIQMALNHYEYELRIPNANQWWNILEQLNDAFPFQKDPFPRLQFERNLQQLRQVANSDFFRQLIQKYLLDQPYVQVEAVPGPGKMQAAANRLTQKLAQLQAQMSPSELDQLIRENAKFDQFVQTPARAEDLAKIPRLDLQDIDKKQRIVPQQIHHLGPNLAMIQELPTNGMIYLNFYFSMNALDAELLPYGLFLMHILENVDTADYPLAQLEIQKRLYIGESFHLIEVVSKFQNPEVFTPFLINSVATKKENLPQTLNIIRSVLTNSLFENSADLGHHLDLLLTNLRAKIMRDPYFLPLNIVRARMSAAGNLMRQFEGDAAYLSIKKMHADFAHNPQVVMENLQTAFQRIFTQENLTIGITTPPGGVADEILPLLAEFRDQLPQLPPRKLLVINKLHSNIAFALPSNVNYVYQGGRYPVEADHPRLSVANLFIDRQLLHQVVRQENGAYGTSISRTLHLGEVFSSYRDPNLGETLATFATAPAWLAQQNLTDQHFDGEKKVILAHFDRPESVRTAGFNREMQFLSEQTDADLQLRRDRLLATTAKAVQSCAETLTRVLAQKIYSAAGSGTAMRAKNELFSEVIELP